MPEAKVAAGGKESRNSAHDRPFPVEWEQQAEAKSTCTSLEVGFPALAVVRLRDSNCVYYVSPVPSLTKPNMEEEY